MLKPGITYAEELQHALALAENCKWLLAKKLKQEYMPVVKPQIVWNTRLGTTAGNCRTRNKRDYARMSHVIELNPKLLIDAIKFKRTLVHELAHAVTIELWPRSKHHGREWKAVMRYMLAEPARCHCYDTSHIKRRQTRAEIQCSCGKIFTLSKNCYTRMTNGTTGYRHKECKRNLIDAKFVRYV